MVVHSFHLSTQEARGKRISKKEAGLICREEVQSARAMQSNRTLSKRNKAKQKRKEKEHIVKTALTQREITSHLF